MIEGFNFWGFEIFESGKFGKYFFGWLGLHASRDFSRYLRWLNRVLRAFSGNSRGGACFKLDKQTWRRKKQWYREDDFSKSTH